MGALIAVVLTIVFVSALNLSIVPAIFVGIVCGLVGVAVDDLIKN